jgi:hypothetical protein
VADKWLVAKDGESDLVLAQHGWTKNRKQGLFFLSEWEAQTHIDGRHINGHPARATAEDEGPVQGMPGAALPDYDPYGLQSRYR